MSGPVIRLVATDLDGTMLRSDGTVSERTVAALAAAEDAGVVVVFVTGRPIRWMTEVFEHVGGHGLAIVSNGAVVYDVAGGRVRDLRAMEPPVGLEVARVIREAVPESAFAVEMVSGLALEPAFLDPHRVPPEARRGELAEVYAEPAVKLLARHLELDPQEFWDRAVAAVGDRAVVTWSSASALLEISAAGVTKATTLAVLAAELGIEASEVLAVGDMPNDLPMLAWAGTSYAMANAHESVVAAADHVAESNDDDGVALLLERAAAALTDGVARRG